MVNIDGAVFLGSKQLFQFCHPALQPLLLLFIVGGHSGEAFVADLALQVVFIKPLDNIIQLADSGLGLLQFPFPVPETFVQFGL